MTGHIRSNDGVLYTQDQWTAAYILVEKHLQEQGYINIDIRPWEVTGAIAGSADQHSVEFYMRDLVLGKVRDASFPDAYLEYQREVRLSGMVS